MWNVIIYIRQKWILLNPRTFLNQMYTFFRTYIITLWYLIIHIFIEIVTHYSWLRSIHLNLRKKWVKRACYINSQTNNTNWLHNTLILAKIMVMKMEYLIWKTHNNTVWFNHSSDRTLKIHIDLWIYWLKVCFGSTAGCRKSIS